MPDVASNIAHNVASAERLLAQGKADEACRMLAAIRAGADANADRLKRRARDLVVRKHIRQNRFDAVRSEAAADPALRLLAARTLGDPGVAALVDAEPGTAEGRLGAALLAADLRAGLGILRRIPGCATLAEGWMALARGNAAHAAELFGGMLAPLPGGAPPPRALAQRARSGLAVAFACLGRRVEAQAEWNRIGPLPQTLYPLASAFARALSAAAATWDASQLRGLMATGGPDELERALAACPQSQRRERAWLAMRLGDRRWEESPGDGRSLQAWNQALHDEPALRGDCLKRLAISHAALARSQALAHLRALHEHLAREDTQRARRVLDAILRGFPGEILDGLELPHGPGDPPPFVRAWLNQELRGDGPSRLRWRQVAALLEPLSRAYGQDEEYRRERIAILRSFRRHADWRKACAEAMFASPGRAEELLPDYLAAAAACQRHGRAAVGAKQLHAEVVRIEQLLGRPDYELMALHARLTRMLADQLEDLASRLPGPLARLFRFQTGIGPEPDPALAGRDEDYDLRLLCLFPRLTEASARQPAAMPALRALLRSPERLHALIHHHRSRLDGEICAIAQAWRRCAPKDWRPYYHLANHAHAHRRAGAGEQVRQALSRMGAADPERAEVERLRDAIERRDAEGEPWFEGDDEDDQEDEDGDLEDGDEEPGGWFRPPSGARRRSAAGGRGRQGPAATGHTPQQMRERMPPEMVDLLGGAAAADLVVSVLTQVSVEEAAVFEPVLCMLVLPDREAQARIMWSMSLHERRCAHGVLVRFSAAGIHRISATARDLQGMIAGLLP